MAAPTYIPLPPPQDAIDVAVHRFEDTAQRESLAWAKGGIVREMREDPQFWARLRHGFSWKDQAGMIRTAPDTEEKRAALEAFMLAQTFWDPATDTFVPPDIAHDPAWFARRPVKNH
jgi:hypothetical protein